MNKEGWEMLILQAAEEYQRGDSATLRQLAAHLEQCDQAKQELRNKGYGWTGVDILNTAKMVRADD